MKSGTLNWVFTTTGWVSSWAGNWLWHSGLFNTNPNAVLNTLLVMKISEMIFPVIQQ